MSMRKRPEENLNNQMVGSSAKKQFQPPVILLGQDQGSPMASGLDSVNRTQETPDDPLCFQVGGHRS